MIEPAKIQLLYQGRVPVFVVIPFADFARKHPTEAAQIKPKTPYIPEGDYVPHEVVGLHIERDITYFAPGGNTWASPRPPRSPKGPGSPRLCSPKWNRGKQNCARPREKSWQRPWA